MIDWLNEFYTSPETRLLLEESYAPLFTELGTAVAGAAGKEVGIAAPAVGAFVQSMLQSYVNRYMESSRAQLQELLGGDDPAEAIAQRLAEWGEKRPGKVAAQETFRTANAVTETVYKDAGVTRKRWNSRGKSCPYCKRMDGKVVGIDRPFHKQGDAIEVPDSEIAAKAKLNFTHEIGHPPQHAGCDCVIEADMQLGLPGFGGADVPLVSSRNFGSDAEALAWAERSMPDVKKLPKDLRDGLEGYSGSGFGPTNRVLRGQSRDYLRGNEFDPDMVGQELAEAVAEEEGISNRVTAKLDKAMAPIPENVTVYRAFKENALVDGFRLPTEDLDGLRTLVGQSFEDAGFMSTSLGTGVADTYRGMPIHMNLTVTKGTKAIYMRPISYYQNENELLLNRGTRFTITGVHQEGETWIVDAVVPPS